MNRLTENNQYDHWFYHDKDVIAEYSRVLGCSLNDRTCQDRLDAMVEYRSNGTPLPPLGLDMQDHDLRTVTYDSHELKEDGPIQVANFLLGGDREHNDRSSDRVSDGAGNWSSDEDTND